ncbi:MAG TPA: hypothetical protein VFY29_09910 [Terriglobia bacterium]|nr:hypothetical protein [Terriglobia bacterium]
MKQIATLVACALMTLTAGFAQEGRGRGGAQSPPDIAGEWSGTWATYSPSAGAVPPQTVCASLNATITAREGVWEAVFEGDCGRPYKYSIKMEGRQAGSAVLFKGTTDLGPRDGGVYDWVGRATTGEFVGFYTSAASTGVFSLTRKKK